MKVIVTDFDNKEHHLEAIEGWRIMEIIRDYGLPIKAECGGACCCATCHVYVDEDWLGKIPEARDDELDMLDGAVEIEDNSRLSCQLIMCEALDGIRLKLAPTG
jgi:2Fe-2S ferredoxin